MVKWGYWDIISVYKLSKQEVDKRFWGSLGTENAKFTDFGYFWLI